MVQAKYNPGSRPEIARLRLKLTKLEKRCSEVDPSDEIAGDLSRYFCVRVAGFLEQAVASISRATCERTSGGPALAFGLSWLERVPNMRSGELTKHVHRFGPSYSEPFTKYLLADERGERINALMGIRNQIAHGKDQGVSLRQALDYYRVVNEVVDWLLEHLDPIASQ